MGSVIALRRKADIERSSDDEAALLDRCRRGDRQAMGIVLGEHAGALERHVTRLMGPGPDVEDTLQQVFIAAIGAFPRFRGEAKVRTWLTRIATHVAIDALRSPARRRAREALSPDGRPSHEAAPDEVTRAREELRRLDVILEQLTPVRRVAFILHVLEGHSIEEVAALTDASTMATKSRIFWARRQVLALARRDALLRERFGEER